MKMMKIALAQVNPVVGALPENTNKIISYIEKAKSLGADLVAFPELCLCGYPPEDLLLKPHFIKENKKFLNKIINASSDIFSIVGFPYLYKGVLFNSAAIIHNRKLIQVYKKMHLPNYDVFDELRYFKAGNAAPVVQFKDNFKIGVNICEDIWHPEGPQRAQALLGKAKIIINISASPYHHQKINLRHNMLKERAKENKVFLFYCNLAGGQDELVFDGASMAFDSAGRLIARARQFEEDLLIIDINSKNRIEKMLKPLDEIYCALILGLRDYTRKNGFKKVVLGLSGGIDSALVAVLANDALGKDNVIALSMPSIYSSKGTQSDGKKIAKNLGIKFITIPINSVYKTYLKTLSSPFKDTEFDIAEENIQARIRGNILMAFSNKFGWLVITTGNKSELSVGYCTLYGDTAGGFAVIKDIPKTLVYKLARFRNSKSKNKLIPETVFLRAPSAELKRNQKDQDTLPPYGKLDKILDNYIEKDHAMENIIRKGFDKKLVKAIISMVDKNEYKRRQSPIGVKITPKAFGKDRRMPITNKFHE